MNDFLIVANGCFLHQALIQEAAFNKTLIALDGAADKLQQFANLTPHVILGDFDSINAKTWGIEKTFAELSEQDQPYTNAQGILIVPAKNQQYTDLHKAILYCDERGASSIHIICATGGRMDLHEGTMRVMRRTYQKQRPILLHTDIQTLRFVRNEHLLIQGEVGDKCGILAYPQGRFTSQGLMYEGQDFPLEFAESESMCNVLREKEARLEIKGDALVVMPGMFRHQR